LGGGKSIDWAVWGVGCLEVSIRVNTRVRRIRLRSGEVSALAFPTFPSSSLHVRSQYQGLITPFLCWVFRIVPIRSLSGSPPRIRSSRTQTTSPLLRHYLCRLRLRNLLRLRPVMFIHLGAAQAGAIRAGPMVSRRALGANLSIAEQRCIIV
jgi:hypothetical protein